jgi:NAD-dependent SIR2 family protein deacetylase
MAQTDQQPSPRQLKLLERAQSAPPFVVVRSLYEAIEELKEPLHPQWRQIWARVRDHVGDNVPRGVIEEVDQAVQAIQPVDSAIQELRVGEQQRICLLLGAGASASPPSSIPTVVSLLPELWRRARKLGRDDIDRLATWCEERKISNIEDLLTAAYLANFSAKSASISSLLNYFLFRGRNSEEESRGLIRGYGPASQIDAASVALFQDTLQGLFGLLTGTMIPAPPNKGHEAIVGFLKSHARCSIVTTNYDGCMDEALIRASVPFVTHITGSPSESSESQLDLIKIHGSINWSYCDSCHDVREFDLLRLKEGFQNDTITFAVVGVCKNCGGQRRPLLIPPMGLKFVMFPNLIRLWNVARERIESSDILIVVGFSFSEADSYINKIIERSMSFKADQIMVICDPNASLAATLRARYSARIEGFDNNRVLQASGSGDEVVPLVLERLIRQVTSESIGGTEAEDREQPVTQAAE